MKIASDCRQLGVFRVCKGGSIIYDDDGTAIIWRSLRPNQILTKRNRLLSRQRLGDKGGAPFLATGSLTAVRISVASTLLRRVRLCRDCFECDDVLSIIVGQNEPCLRAFPHRANDLNRLGMIA